MRAANMCSQFLTTRSSRVEMMLNGARLIPASAATRPTVVASHPRLVRTATVVVSSRCRVCRLQAGSVTRTQSAAGGGVVEVGQDDQGDALLDLVTDRDPQLRDDAGGRCADWMFHLHRLEPIGGSPASTRSPIETATRTADPGIGAVSAPAGA